MDRYKVISQFRCIAPVGGGLCLSTVLLSAGSATAASFSETGPHPTGTNPSGNYGDFLDPDDSSFGFAPRFDLGTLGPGVTTVDGILYNGPATSGGSFVFDTDAFVFTVPVEMTVDSIVFTGEPTVPGTAVPTVMEFRLETAAFFDPAGEQVPASVDVTPGDDGLALSALSAPLGPGAYALSIKEKTTTFMSASDPLDYTLTFTVVPEPGSLALLALGGCAVFRRRR